MSEQDFGAIVEQYGRLVYSVCYQFSRDHHIAEDLAQETFLSAYTHLASCPADSLKPWLCRIAANKAKDHLKSAYNRKISTAEDETIRDSKTVMFARDERPEDLAISKEQTARIENDIRALKEPYHQVAVLYFLEELPVEEIARALERPPKTVHTQIYRARRILQEALGEEFKKPPKGGDPGGAV